MRYELLFILPLLALLAITGATIWRFLKNKRKIINKAIIAHTENIKKLDAYKKATLFYRILIVATSTVFMATLAISTMIASRPVTRVLDQNQNAARDIMLCLDVSSSMHPYVVDVLNYYGDISSNLKGERIGITIFDGAVMQVLPLTNDYAALAETIENMSSGSNIRNYAQLVSVNGRYSLIGNGLVNCVNNMGEKDQDTRARAVILATDNNGQTGSDTINLSLEQAGEYAKSRGIIIYGIDTNESERKTENYGYRNSSREFEDAVSNTKGAYVRLGQNKSLSVSMITESIMASLEKYTLSDAKRVETDAPNNYIIALAIATGILLFVIWRLKV